MNREMLVTLRLLVPAAICIASLLGGCAVTTKLQSPLPFKDFTTSSDDEIGLHIPEASKKYMWRGNINVTPYSVEFGNALEANAKLALTKVFREVMVIDHFPPVPSPPNVPVRAVSLEIGHATVSPGALTFSSTSAAVHLKARLAKGSQVETEPILVEGLRRHLPGSWELSLCCS